MKNNKLHIGINETLKANKIANRDIFLENSTGFISIHKAHKSAKDYTRNNKHKNRVDFF